MNEYTVTAEVEVTVKASNEDNAITQAHREITFGTDVVVREWLGIEKEPRP
jgi:hypothetical protein